MAVQAFEKGRSNSCAMNRLCRQSSAYQFVSGIRWKLRHIETLRNIADRPSRLFEKRTAKKKSSGPRPFETRHYAVPDCSGTAMASRGPVTFDGVFQALHPRIVKAGAEVIPKKPACGSRADVHRSCGIPIPRVHTVSSVAPKYVLELFGGTAVLTSACASRKLNCLFPFELGNGHIFDLRRRSTQKIVIDLIRSGKIWYIHLGTPCTIWSRARHNISNLARAREKEKVGVELALFSCEIIRECIQCNVLFSLENPATSRIFGFRPLIEIMKHATIKTAFQHVHVW